MSEQVICMIRLIDAGLWDSLEELYVIYADLDILAASKVIAKMRQYVDNAIAGGLSLYLL